MLAERSSIQRRILFVVKNLYTMERLDVMYLSSLAQGLGWETDLVVVDDLSYPEIVSRVRRSRPDILGFSVMSPEYPAVRDLALRLRADTDCFMLFGGPHPTFSQAMVREPFVDGILFGEGEVSFPKFLERFAGREDYSRTEGMHFHLAGEVVLNGPIAPTPTLPSTLQTHRRRLASSACKNSSG